MPVINQQRLLQALLTNYGRQLTYTRLVAYKSHKHFTPAYKTLRILNPKSTLRTANITAGPSLREPDDIPPATVRIEPLRKPTSASYVTRKDAGHLTTPRKNRISQERDLRAELTNIS